MFRLIPIISIGLIILLILGGVFFWWPKLQDFLNLRTDLEGKENEIKQKEEYFVKLQDLSDQLALRSDQLAKIDAALPEDPSIPGLFYFIQKTSSENGLILESLSLGAIAPSQTKSGVEEISLSGSVSGSYAAFKNFLTALYRNARIFEIDSISFSSPEISSLFNFGLTVTTHAYSGSGKEEIKSEY